LQPIKGPPVVSVVGWSNSGKTTFLVQLVRELKARGYRVGTVKHHHGEMHFDQPGKDTWQHARAGADIISLAGTSGFWVYKKIEKPRLSEILGLMPEMDIVITEGFKSEKTPKIEVRRPGTTSKPAVYTGELLALVDEDAGEENVPCFSPGDYKAVADFLEKTFLK